LFFRAKIWANTPICPCLEPVCMAELHSIARDPRIGRERNEAGYRNTAFGSQSDSSGM
jgi:hypothetical protein